MIGDGLAANLNIGNALIDVVVRRLLRGIGLNFLSSLLMRLMSFAQKSAF